MPALQKLEVTAAGLLEPVAAGTRDDRRALGF